MLKVVIFANANTTSVPHQNFDTISPDSDTTRKHRTTLNLMQFKAKGYALQFFLTSLLCCLSSGYWEETSKLL